MVYKLTFEFTDDFGNSYKATAKNHITDLLEDESKEQLLYDPKNPSYAVMLDNLPGSPDVDDMGNIQVADLGRSIRSLILPVIIIFGNGIAFLFITLR